MAAEQGFLTEQEAGAEITKMLGTEPTPETKAEKAEKREVKFTARVKAKKAEAKAAEKPIPLTPADGSPDPDEELADEEKAATEAEDADEDAAPVKDKEAADEDDDDNPAPRMLKVKVDGQEQEVAEEEVVKGYSRTADYTRKTQALAKERETVEAEREHVALARQEYAEKLAALATVVQMPGEEPEWDTLREQLTPEEFTQRFTEWRGGLQRMAKVRAEQERVRALQVEDVERALRRTLQAEDTKLKAALPDLADPEKGKQLKDDLIAYAKSSTYGFNDDDLATVTDHRLLVLLDKARRWDQSQKQRPKIEDKIDRALDALKPSATKSKSKTSDTERVQARLAQTGSVDDAALLISRML